MLFFHLNIGDKEEEMAEKSMKATGWKIPGDTRYGIKIILLQSIRNRLLKQQKQAVDLGKIRT